VVALPDVAALEGADLVQWVGVEPVPAAGTNVELVVPLGEEEVDGEVVGTIRMRVQERGVGETRSCGTGACAAALAVRARAGAGDGGAQEPGRTVRTRYPFALVSRSVGMASSVSSQRWRESAPRLRWTTRWARPVGASRPSHVRRSSCRAALPIRIGGFDQIS